MFAYRNTSESEVRFTEVSCNTVSDMATVCFIVKVHQICLYSR